MEHSRLAQVQKRKHSILEILFLSLNIYLILYWMIEAYMDNTKINSFLNGEYIYLK